MSLYAEFEILNIAAKRTKKQTIEMVYWYMHTNQNYQYQKRSTMI